MEFPLVNKQLPARLVDDDLTLLNELIPELFPDRDLSDKSLSGREIIMALAERAAMKLKKATEPRPEDQMKIKELEDIIKEGREKSEKDHKNISDLDDNLTTANSEITRLNGVIEDLRKLLQETSEQHSQIAEKAQKLEKYAPVANEMRIVVEPLTLKLLQLYAEKIRLRTKTEVTPGDVLTTLFNRYVTRRETELPGFPFLVSKSEIQELAKSLKDEQNAE